MRTNIVIDEELVKKGIHYTGLRTKKELVNYALRELVQRKERKEILRLKGKLHWEGDLEEMRRSLYLLHQDSDFDRIASVCPLKI